MSEEHKPAHEEPTQVSLADMIMEARSELRNEVHMRLATTYGMFAGGFDNSALEVLIQGGEFEIEKSKMRLKKLESQKKEEMTPEELLISEREINEAKEELHRELHRIVREKSERIAGDYVDIHRWIMANKKSEDLPKEQGFIEKLTDAARRFLKREKNKK